MEDDLVDDEILGRRAAPVAEARRAEHGEGHDDRGHERERDEPEQPQPGGARLRRAAGLGCHQSSTSMKPIHPSSANSVLCAWNMYLPVYGKRISRIPRWPCTWLIVSVNSIGWSEVPVGK